MIRIVFPSFYERHIIGHIYFMAKVFIFIRIPQFLRLMGLNTNEDISFTAQKRKEILRFFYLSSNPSNWWSPMENHWMRRQKKKKIFIALINFSALSLRILFSFL